MKVLFDNWLTKLCFLNIIIKVIVLFFNKVSKETMSIRLRDLSKGNLFLEE